MSDLRLCTFMCAYFHIISLKYINIELIFTFRYALRGDKKNALAN